jgi:hypothetical protein
MGLEAYYEGQRRIAAEQRDSRRKEKAKGRPIGKPGLLTRFLINKLIPDLKDEGMKDMRGYVELVVARDRRLQGKPVLFAVWDVKDERARNKDNFLERATEFLDYKRTLTQGEWGISEETFQHCLNADPNKVVQDALHWTINMRAMTRGAPEAGPPQQTLAPCFTRLKIGIIHTIM